MAKKSSQKRQNQAARGAANRPQTNAATLVRPTHLNAADAETATGANTAVPTPRPAATSVVRDTPAAPKAAPKPGTRPTAPAAKSPAAPVAPSGKRQDTRLARAKATQRARQAGMISAENYGYVLQDLKLVGILAVCAIAALIVLTFTLPH